MKSFTSNDLVSALKTLGLTESDTVLVHSDLRSFGIPEALRKRDEILSFYYNAFRQVLGESGTLAVPAYFYEYAREGVPFDTEKSTVSAALGSFSSFINAKKGRIRSANPLQSIAAIGNKAFELSGSDSLSGYGVTSPWHILKEMKGKILFFGAPLQSMTYVHYIEQHFGVPHLYFKMYPYPIYRNGKQLPGHAISAVRYLNFSVEYEISKFQQELEAQGALKTTHLNSGLLHMVDAESAFEIGISCLNKNPYFFLKHPPKFISGEIPMDGIFYE